MAFLIVATFKMLQDVAVAPGVAPAVAAAEAGIELGVEPAEAGGVGGIGP